VSNILFHWHYSFYPTTLYGRQTDRSYLRSYKQALHGAKTARALAAEHRLPFARPDDFFAEMVKTDAHMERIRQRLLDESASIVKSEARRREREGKKVGKQVQIEKLKERQRNKKDMEERLKGLKRSTFLPFPLRSLVLI
jgi:rRNA-processing protein EBP2